MSSILGFEHSSRRPFPFKTKNKGHFVNILVATSNYDTYVFFWGGGVTSSTGQHSSGVEMALGNFHEFSSREFACHFWTQHFSN